MTADLWFDLHKHTHLLWPALKFRFIWESEWHLYLDGNNKCPAVDPNCIQTQGACIEGHLDTLPVTEGLHEGCYRLNCSPRSMLFCLLERFLPKVGAGFFFFFHTSARRGTRTSLWLESHAGEAGDESDQSHCSSRASHPNSQRLAHWRLAVALIADVIVTCRAAFRSIEGMTASVALRRGIAKGEPWHRPRALRVFLGESRLEVKKHEEFMVLCAAAADWKQHGSKQDVTVIQTRAGQ